MTDPTVTDSTPVPDPSPPVTTWPDVLTTLVRGEDLDSARTRWAMDRVLGGEASAVQVAALMVALRAKGETVAELTGLADGMLGRATPITLTGDAVDVVGTGGDRANTVNISTMAAVVAAACGARVVKHGNRAASSACGTADVLEQLGVALDVAPERQEAVLDEVGIVFLFAAHYHPSLRHAASARRELGIATTFNALGPLANPARPAASAVGVGDPRMAPLVAGVFAGRGNRGLVFHGGDGLDELTTTTDSDVWLFSGGEVRRTALEPRDLGIDRCRPEDLVGGQPPLNAAIARRVLAGETGPVADIVALNAAAALLAYHGPELDTPLADQLQPLLQQARTAMTDGSAADTLRRWAAATRHR